ncbi:TULIP family P47-like protein [Microcystis wesenbergii]|uniref:TULIP family P47-like protein n=1 Tax=Microcystis wesenbergii NRERC-220 TaxID=3068991 RepID=A0ABU3HPJ5_9CHRO|nr:TULIP family P47-like protein [Microcystis wesenbergii]MDT3675288.1 TULIP family P47-like protein [Microcystis wesenbergii NRERC-220]
MSQNVNTFGWNTVYAASVPVVNNAIVTQKSFPTSFDYPDNVGVHIKGNWKSWQLISGGSGSNVQMKCIVDSGTISGLGQPDGDLKDASLIIQVKLQKIADASLNFTDTTAKPDTGTANAIKVNTQAIGDDPVVSVLQSSQYPNVSVELFKDLLGSVFGHYFNANISSFSHVFSVMMLNQQAAKDDFAWLKPTDLSYAVGSTEDDDLSKAVFATLCLTDGATISGGMQQAVDISALQGLPPDANSSFVISPEKVTQHMLFKGAVATIQGSKDSDFTIGSDQVSIRNVNKITWGNFQTDNGVISPTINVGNFTMTLQDDHILLEIVNAEYEPSAGITVHLTLTQKFGFKTVKRDSDGKYVFIPDTSSFGSPHIVTAVSISEGLKILEITLAVVGAVAGLAAGASGIGALIAKGATVAAEGAAASAEISAEVVEEAIESASEESIEAAENEAALSVDEGISGVEGAAQVQKGSFLLTGQFRAYCGLAAAIAGVSSAGIAVAKFVTEEDYDKVPAFNDFAANCLGTTKWPATNNAELVSVDLRNSLVMGIKLS